MGWNEPRKRLALLRWLKRRPQTPGPTVAGRKSECAAARVGIPEQTTVAAGSAVGRTALRRHGLKTDRLQDQEPPCVSASWHAHALEHARCKALCSLLEAGAAPRPLTWSSRATASAVAEKNFAARTLHAGGRPHGRSRCAAAPQCGTWILVLMCLRLATMVKVITTSMDHELHLPTCTADQAPNWLG